MTTLSTATLALVLGCSSALVSVLPAAAASEKETSCTYQAQVVAAIQNARLNRVKERDVPNAVAATNPTWPEPYNNAIPLIAPWVYEQKMKDLKSQNLGEVWMELCVQQ